ncbi:MAG: POTRA domain-containing protein, partial [Thermoanaerobaculia bacterium]
MKSPLLVLGLLIAAALNAQTEPPLRIGTITIHPLDVYSKDEARHGRLYQLADRLHIETRESVIRKFLLFREGDVYSPERLAETERNLRAMQFLKSALVVASSPHDGVVDVVVTTQDSWSIAPETQAGSKGGKSTVGAT